MVFYRYKYRKGKIPLQQQVYDELPYDMQVSNVQLCGCQPISVSSSCTAAIGACMSACAYCTR